MHLFFVTNKKDRNQKTPSLFPPVFNVSGSPAIDFESYDCDLLNKAVR